MSLAGQVNLLATRVGTEVKAIYTALAGKAATVHTHVAADLSNSTTVGRSLITAADATAGRTAITAAAATHTHVATTDLTATGTKNSTTYLRGDDTWATVSASVADATTTTKGQVQLAGDLAGTAAAPTVPGLTGKANTSHTHPATDLTATGRTTTNFLRGDNTWATPAFTFASAVTLTDGATIATNAALGQLFRVTLATQANSTFSAPTNAADGMRIMYEISASGAARGVIFTTGAAGAFAFGGDVTGIPSITAATTTFVGCVYSSRNSRWNIIAIANGYI
jgi:hypothetical protein